MDKLELHRKICSDLHELYKAKNSDYGDSFGESFKKYGIIAAMVRMEDKWNRINNILKNKGKVEVGDETIGDTLLDMANYAIMTHIELYKDESDKMLEKESA